jgi:hypothetical protein
MAAGLPEDVLAFSIIFVHVSEFTEPVVAASK